MWFVLEATGARQLDSPWSMVGSGCTICSEKLSDWLSASCVQRHATPHSSLASCPSLHFVSLDQRHSQETWITGHLLLHGDHLINIPGCPHIATIEEIGFRAGEPHSEVTRQFDCRKYFVSKDRESAIHGTEDSPSSNVTPSAGTYSVASGVAMLPGW